jgi:hypothetical protein
MAVRTPVVRHFIACQRAERSPDGRFFTLHKLIQAFRPGPNAGASPAGVDLSLTLFAVVTDGHGQHSFQVKLVTWDPVGNERLLTESARFTVDLGQDPLAVRNLPMRWTVTLPGPGLYEFRLVSEGEILARETIVWRATP